jgi:hypothetical protein
MTTEAMPLPETSTAAERREARAARRARPGAPHPIGGMLWFGGWLFAIGFAKLIWWKALLALVVWPYFLGVAVR